MRFTKVHTAKARAAGLHVIIAKPVHSRISPYLDTLDVTLPALEGVYTMSEGTRQGIRVILSFRRARALTVSAQKFIKDNDLSVKGCYVLTNLYKIIVGDQYLIPCP